MIGESTQRGHLSLYGYSKQTNPLLSNQKNILLFQDVISPHAQTTLVLQKLLTFANYENEKKQKWYLQPNLISIFNKSGYKTYWISNQMNNVHFGIIGNIASLSSKSIFTSQYRGDFDNALYDDALIKPIKETLQSNLNSNNFFIIHLMGAHSSYKNRYPSDFKVFDNLSFDKKTRRVADYDNAIVYNDFIVDSIFKIFEKTDALVIYIPDHGEEMFEYRDFNGHADANISRFMVEIPMIIYASNLFIKKHTLLYNQIKQSLKLPYMSDDLIHTIIDIASINVKGFEQTRSIVNKNFNLYRKRIVGGSMGIDYDAKLKSQVSSYK